MKLTTIAPLSAAFLTLAVGSYLLSTEPAQVPRRTARATFDSGEYDNVPERRDVFPAALAAAAPPELPYAEEQAPPAPPESTPQQLDDAERTEQARATEEQKLLTRQEPMAFLPALLDTITEVSSRTEELATLYASRYIEDRTEALGDMYASYVQNPSYDPTDDLEYLIFLDDDYRRNVVPLENEVPGIADFANVLSRTALPVPSFARERYAEMDPRPEPENFGPNPPGIESAENQAPGERTVPPEL